MSCPRWLNGAYRVDGPYWPRAWAAVSGVVLLGCSAQDIVAIATPADGGQASSETAGASASVGTSGSAGTSSGGGTGGAPATELTLWYSTFSRAASVPRTRPAFEIHNEGASAAPLSELEIRYFFTNEGSDTPSADCPLLQASCDVLKLSFGQVDPARPLADTYLSISFDPAASDIPPGAKSETFEVGFRNSGVGLVQQDNDYSFDPDATDAAPSETSCLYRKGTLIWGIEPPL